MITHRHQYKNENYKKIIVSVYGEEVAEVKEHLYERKSAS